jgi:hypothetical protein
MFFSVGLEPISIDKSILELACRLFLFVSERNAAPSIRNCLPVKADA